MHHEKRRFEHEEVRINSFLVAELCKSRFFAALILSSLGFTAQILHRFLASGRGFTCSGDDFQCKTSKPNAQYSSQVFINEVKFVTSVSNHEFFGFNLTLKAFDEFDFPGESSSALTTIAREIATPRKLKRVLIPNLSETDKFSRANQAF